MKYIPQLNMIKDIKLFAKRVKLKASGKVSHFRKGVECNAVWYGKENAGFYVCPDFINEESIIYSIGIGEDISFDREIIERHGAKVFGFDPTPKSINWIKSQNLPFRFEFFEYGISDKTGKVDFYMPKNPEYISGSMVAQTNVTTSEKVAVQMKSLQDIADELHHTHIDILKMDIEGSEYDVVNSILNANVTIGQIFIEFHDRFVTDGARRSAMVVEALRQYGYAIFAVANSFEEISFIHSSLVPSSK